MLVIDLASLTKSMTASGGFFCLLKANGQLLKPIAKGKFVAPGGQIKFSDTYSKDEIKRVQRDLDRSFVDMMLANNRAALFRLFPNAKDRVPLKINHEDIDDLRGRFDDLTRDIENDRNDNRAHRYQNEPGKAAERLSFQKLAKRFEEIEAMLNDLRLAFEGIQMTYSDMNNANVDQTSIDMIFAILFGTTRSIDTFSGLNKLMQSCETTSAQFGDELRSDLLESCHFAHDQLMMGTADPTALGLKKLPTDLAFNNLVFAKTKLKR